MAGTLNNYIAKFSEGLGKCTNAEQVMDLIIGEISDIAGMPKFTVQEMRDGWHSIGTYIDDYVALGQGLRQRATDLRQHADAKESGSDAGANFAPPPPLPPGPGAGAGAAAGGAAEAAAGRLRGPRGRGRGAAAVRGGHVAAVAGVTPARRVARRGRCRPLSVVVAGRSAVVRSSKSSPLPRASRPR